MNGNFSVSEGLKEVIHMIEKRHIISEKIPKFSYRLLTEIEMLKVLFERV